jgi:hypothetical protein
MAYPHDDDFLEEEWVSAGDEGDEPDDWDDEGTDDEADLIDCPECGKQIHGESEQCPYCGYFIPDAPGSSLWQGRSWWWVALGVLGIIAVIIAFSRPW